MEHIKTFELFNWGIPPKPKKYDNLIERLIKKIKENNIVVDYNRKFNNAYSFILNNNKKIVLYKKLLVIKFRDSIPTTDIEISKNDVTNTLFEKLQYIIHYIYENQKKEYKNIVDDKINKLFL